MFDIDSEMMYGQFILPPIQFKLWLYDDDK